MNADSRAQGAAERSDLIGWMLALSLFSPLLKPLTGIRELMLLPDVILYALALRCLLRGPRRPLTSPALFAILCFGVFYLIAALQIFNPNVPSLTAGLEGFRKTAWTSVAFFLAVMSMRTRSDVDRILRWVIFAGCLVALYGLKQAIWWSAFDDRIVESQSAGYWTAMGWGGRYRAVGTLSGPFHLGILGVQLFGLGRMLQVRASSLVLERRLAWLVMGPWTITLP